LRGKILNVERARLDRVLNNEEIRNIITAVGNGIGEEEDPAKRRYGKIVMMSDADVDGSHIRTLLMTFFYRQMPRLVAEGHLYVAQPPLYMIVSGKKDRRYVQTDDQMQMILMETGLTGAELHPVRITAHIDNTLHASQHDHDVKEGTMEVVGERLKSLIDLVVAIELGLRAFGRRNRSLRNFLAMAHPAGDAKLDARAGLLPQFIIEDQGKEIPCWSEEERDQYCREQRVEIETESEFEKIEQRTVCGGQGARDLANGLSSQAGHHKVRCIELHEVKTLNKHLARLRDEFGLRADALLPCEVTGDDPPPRFTLQRDSENYPLLDLRALVPVVRKMGEKGMKITRFKGLGEMDAEQLWETTMDPSRRTLMQVRLDDAAAANDLFSTLMGDDVEPRREFIEKHALEVKNLDV
jgi:DNA gyrase subunit B